MCNFNSDCEGIPSMISLRVGDMTLTICRDEKVAEQYLMLPELGRVLQELRRALPGKLLAHESCLSL